MRCDIGASLTAEGIGIAIEAAEELGHRTLLGVAHGSGYLVDRPTSPHELLDQRIQVTPE